MCRILKKINGMDLKSDISAASIVNSQIDISEINNYPSQGNQFDGNLSIA